MFILNLHSIINDSMKILLNFYWLKICEIKNKKVVVLNNLKNLLKKKEEVNSFFRDIKVNN